MAEFTYVVTQRVAYYEGVEFDSPQEVICWIEAGGEWDDRRNHVVSDRVEVYDADGKLVADTEPGDCTECGSTENAGLRDGLPYCHRHIGKKCGECGEVINESDPHAGYGMCAGCLHDALRSGWNPGEED